MRNSEWKRARSEGSDNYKRNGKAEMKSEKKGKKYSHARHLDGPFAHFTRSKIGKVEDEMDFKNISKKVTDTTFLFTINSEITLHFTKQKRNIS